MPDAFREVPSLPAAAQGAPSVAAQLPLELPLELLDDIARRGGWRGWARTWSKVAKHFSLAWLLSDPRERAGVALVPEDAATINAAISLGRDVVMVRPGIYRESVRMTHDVKLLGLGEPGSAQVNIFTVD